MDTKSEPPFCSCKRTTLSTTGTIDTCDKKAQYSHLTRFITLLFAITCGLAVANVYFAQPLLDSMASDLNVQTSSIGIVVTITQIGYAFGLLFIVPLGDLVNHRNLIISQMFLSIIALLVVGFAANISMLLAGMLGVGLLAVVVQVVVAYAAALAPSSQRGQVIGTVTSGVVIGILLARFVSGLFADLTGWRSVYFISSAAMLLMIIMLYKKMPQKNTPKNNSSYPKLLFSVCQLFISEPILRIRALLALFNFASFSVLWTAMVLPLSMPPFQFTHTQIGMFGLVGVAGALAATKAGKWADHGFAQRTTGLSFLLLTFSWLLTAMLGLSMAAFILGIIMLDFAVQAIHVTNQSLIFAARPDAESRLVGGYMVFYSIGSAIGAIASTHTYAFWGWSGVCILGALISSSGLLFWYFTKDYGSH